MTPDERQLITALFDRMRGFNLPEKDGEAEALINESIGSLRDAPYMLVQSVLVQEQALQQAEARIRDLEEEVQALEGAAQQRSSGSGSFLGGLFGGRPATDSEPARGPTSVPAVGARATPPVYGGSPAWGASRQPGQPGVPPAAQTAPAGGGGFLQSAMATAAGVAGGMLVAGAISNMLGGHSAHAGSGSGTGSQSAGDATNASKDTSQSPEAAKSQDASASENESYQDGYQDAVDDGGGWFGGDDGGDLDI
jgi:hypothetical protein